MCVYRFWSWYSNRGGLYLHDDEEEEGDEDADLRVFPGLMLTGEVEGLGHAMLVPCLVVEQGHQRLVLRELHVRTHHIITFITETLTWLQLHTEITVFYTEHC